MFTNVAVQVMLYSTNILTAVVRQYLSCYYFGKGVVIVYRVCALSLGFNTVLSICPISGIHTGGGGGRDWDIPPKHVLMEHVITSQSNTPVFCFKNVQKSCP